MILRLRGVRQAVSCTILVLGLPLAASAGEPDDFMARADKEAKVANEFLNNALNYKLQLVAEQYDSILERQPYVDPKGACSQKLFLDLMVDTFDRNFPDIYDVLGNVSAFELRAGSKRAEDTRMKDWIPFHHKMWLPSYRVKTADAEFVIGIDKIDHFFAHGYLNYLAVEKSKTGTRAERLRNALKFNVEQENGPWGLKGAKVKSYADVSASELGMKFWKDLLDGPNPYFQCEKGRYVQRRRLDLFQLIDASLDESVNCSSYAEKEIRDAIVTHSKNLGVACPVDPQLCKRLVRAKKPNADLTLHPLCRAIADSQVESASSLTVRDVMQVGASLTSIGNLMPFWFGSGPSEIPQTKKLVPYLPTANPIQNSVPVPAQGGIETPKQSETAR